MLLQYREIFGDHLVSQRILITKRIIFLFNK
ncbi:Uncharacterised protein r2_g3206 [Pycnogonum litorale]